MVGRKKGSIKFRLLAVTINRQSNWWLHWCKDLFVFLLIRKQNLNKAQLIGYYIILKQIVQFYYQCWVQILGVVSFDAYQLVFLGVRMIAQPNIVVTEPALSNSTGNNKES